MKSTLRIYGMEKTISGIKNMSKVPQKYVTASSRKGMSIVLKVSKASAPFDTGMLKKGIVLKGERSRIKGKKVYRIVFDRSLNDVFQKKNKDGKISGYYPISQEYGFFAVNGRYIPGYRFIHNSFNDNAQAMQSKMISEMKKKVDAEIRKAGMK